MHLLNGFIKKVTNISLKKKTKTNKTAASGLDGQQILQRAAGPVGIVGTLPKLCSTSNPVLVWLTSVEYAL